MNRIKLSLILAFGLLCSASVVFCQSTCDNDKAQLCVLEMEELIASVLETTSGVSQTELLQHLCLDVIKGNNLTKCFIDATSPCTGSADAQQNDVIKRWERVMQDLYGLCNGACPNFLERTVNITQCMSLVRFDALYDSSYSVFCDSMNESIECVSNVSESCPQFSKLFYDLLPEGMEDTASNICTGECDNFDEALGRLETCKDYVLDLPEDLMEACESYQKFKTCVRLSEPPTQCPMFASLMEVLYPQHIFGLYEDNCNRTQLEGGEEDKCGDVGVRKMDHCLRIFALAWPNKVDEERPSKKQCEEFMRGRRCLEKAGFQVCPSLEQYFSEKIRGKEKQKDLMNEKCLEVLQDNQGNQENPENSGSPSTALVNFVMLSISFFSLVVTSVAIQ